MNTSSLAITSSAFAWAVFILHWLIVVVLGMRVILKRRATGVTLAWMLIILSVPFVGAVGYLLVGELWLPRRRIQRFMAYRKCFAPHITQIDRSWDVKGDELLPLARMLNAQAHNSLNISTISGNALQLFCLSADCLDSIIQDIDGADSAINLQFYIWVSTGQVVEVEEALIRASGRGVRCRILVDGSGSKGFLRSSRVRELRKAGIEIIEMLPVGIMRNLLNRLDIRNHRKIITIDHDTAYVGSMNMADPKFFGADKGVGTWVDVMARVQGPASRSLDSIIGLDRAIETGIDPADESLSDLQCSAPRSYGQIPIQIVPSGPDQAPRIAHDMLMTLIYNSTKRLIITTPYFIPSEAMLNALTAAALRGVQVSIVVPSHVDSILVRHASKSYYEDLLDVGVQIFLYEKGLLHSKTVTADDEVALLGTVNMDKRSFWINFEVSLFAYDRRISQELLSLQEDYITHSKLVDIQQWKHRPIIMRLTDNLVQLFAPIL